MRLVKYLSSLTKPELEELRELINLSDDEEPIFNELSKGRSKVAVANRCAVSTSTVDNRIKAIKSKINRVTGDCL